MWKRVDSILADFLERGDVVNVGGTIVHVHGIRMADNIEDVVIYGIDDEWEEEFEHVVPPDFYVPIMVYVE